MQYTIIKKIAKGWSSYIWLAKDNTGEKIAIKEVREKSNRKNLAEREGKMLALANTIGIGPNLREINYEKNHVIYDFIDGENFLKFVENNGIKKTSKQEIYEFVKELIRQCLELDKIGLNHTQLQVGKNIMVTKKNGKIFPVIIDFEKASIRNDGKEKNIGQIESFLLYNPNGFVAKQIREKLNLVLN
ncbi:MAG: hypothetical protein PHX27_01775 [Candidatus ainarchaeum sp.]|nr:hypothetical protein [Candidatus ainarchaeum sp.]